MGEQDSSNEHAAKIDSARAPGPEQQEQHGEAQVSAELEADPDGKPFTASNPEEWKRVRDRRQNVGFRFAELMEKGELVNTGAWERQWFSAYLNHPDGQSALQAFQEGVRLWFAAAHYPDVPRLPLFAEACDLAGSTPQHDEGAALFGGFGSLEGQKTYKTALGRNVDRLRRECGWSFDDLADQTKLEKTSILDHVNKGVKPRPANVKVYADVFSQALSRQVTVQEIETDFKVRQ